MDNQEVKTLNTLINRAYECTSFADFLKLAILSLHGLIPYDSGLFFCAISQDSSFFKPYISGPVENHYQKQPFDGREAFRMEIEDPKAQPVVYTAEDFFKGKIAVSEEPRSRFLNESKKFHTACLRIIHDGRFLGEIYLHRTAGAPPFSQKDLFCLKLLQPHISTVMSTIHARIALRQTESAGRFKCGLCVLDAHLSLKGGNISGLEMLKTPTVLGSSLLYHVKELCAELSEGAKAENSSVFKTQQGDINVDVFKSASPVRFFVEMQPAGGDPFSAEYKYKFSKRETEVIDALVQGKNNRQIAESVNLSCNTVKTHVKNIYKKAGVTNRTELTFLLMGGAAGSIKQ